MDAHSSQCVTVQEIFNANQYRTYKLDFCFNNFHIFRFSQSGKGEVDVNSFMSKHSSDYNALFCYDPFAQLAIDASSRMKSCQFRLRGQILKWRKIVVTKACTIIKTYGNHKHANFIHCISCNLFLFIQSWIMFATAYNNFHTSRPKGRVLDTINVIETFNAYQ